MSGALALAPNLLLLDELFAGLASTAPANYPCYFPKDFCGKQYDIRNTVALQTIEESHIDWHSQPKRVANIVFAGIIVGQAQVRLSKAANYLLPGLVQTQCRWT